MAKSKESSVREKPLKWKSRSVFFKVGTEILLVFLLLVSVVCCVGSFYFEELSRCITDDVNRILVQSAAAVLITLYAYVVYRRVLGHWAAWAQADTLWVCCFFALFILLGAITFVEFMLVTYEQWNTHEVWSIYAIPVFGGLFSFLFFIFQGILKD